MKLVNILIVVMLLVSGCSTSKSSIELDLNEVSATSAIETSDDNSDFYYTKLKLPSTFKGKDIDLTLNSVTLSKGYDEMFKESNHVFKFLFKCSDLELSGEDFNIVLIDENNVIHKKSKYIGLGDGIFSVSFALEITDKPYELQVNINKRGFKDFARFRFDNTLPVFNMDTSLYDSITQENFDSQDIEDVQGFWTSVLTVDGFSNHDWKYYSYDSAITNAFLIRDNQIIMDSQRTYPEDFKYRVAHFSMGEVSPSIVFANKDEFVSENESFKFFRPKGPMSINDFEIGKDNLIIISSIFPNSHSIDVLKLISTVEDYDEMYRSIPEEYFETIIY